MTQGVELRSSDSGSVRRLCVTRRGLLMDLGSDVITAPLFVLYRTMTLVALSEIWCSHSAILTSYQKLSTALRTTYLHCCGLIVPLPVHCSRRVVALRSCVVAGQLTLRRCSGNAALTDLPVQKNDA